MQNSSIPSPDGGWGWVVVAASFLIHAVADGVVFSLGELYEEFLTRYGAGNAATSAVISTITGVSLCSGPLASALVSIYGCRAVTIIGSLLAASCIFLSSFASNIWTLFLSSGIGAGIGFGLMYLPPIICVTVYFDKRRSFATGITMCGTGFGTMLFSAVFKQSVLELGLDNTFYLISASVLSCVLFSLAFAPLPDTSQNSECERVEIPLKNLKQPDETIRSEQDGSDQTLLTSTKNLKEADNVDELKTLSEILKPHSRIQKAVGKHKDEPKRRQLQSRPFTLLVTELRNTVKEMMNFQILKNPIFLIFAASNFLTSAGFDVPLVFIPIQAKMKHLDIPINSLLALVGFGNIFGRVILTYIADKKFINRLYLYTICLIICGVLAAASTLCTDMITLSAVWIGYGFLIGSYISLTSVITADLFGMEKLTNSLGIILLFQGIAAFLGPPFAGMLCDGAGFYNPAFYFSGAAILVSGTILLPVGAVKLWMERKEKKRTKLANRIYKGPLDTQCTE